MTLSARADALEAAMLLELERTIPVKSVIYVSGERDPRLGPLVKSRDPAYKGKRKLMGPDPRLPQMPVKPDADRLLQPAFRADAYAAVGAATPARPGSKTKSCWPVSCTTSRSPASSKAITAIGARSWSSRTSTKNQLGDPRAPSVALLSRPRCRLRVSRSLRQQFRRRLRPRAAHPARLRSGAKHKWYMTARMITVYDIYSFESDLVIEVDEFRDVIEKYFRHAGRGPGLRRLAGRAHVAHDQHADPDALTVGE